jgi:hypothetical protein
MATIRETENAYAEWLSEWTWNWFGTLTFRGYASKTAAIRRFKKWIDAVADQSGGKHFRWVRVLESGPTSGVHFHVLVGGLTTTEPTRWIELWHELAGEADIRPFDKKQNGIRYILKTLAPDGHIDIEFELPQRRAEPMPPGVGARKTEADSNVPKIGEVTSNSIKKKISVIKDQNELVIRVPVEWPFIEFNRKSVLVASTHGPMKTDLRIDGKSVHLNFNAFYRLNGKNSKE